VSAKEPSSWSSNVASESEGIEAEEELEPGGGGSWKEVLFLFEMMRKRLSG